MIFYFLLTLTGCQKQLYDGLQVTVLETGEPLLAFYDYAFSPDRSLLVMRIIEMKDDVPRKTIRDDAIREARFQGKERVQVIELTTQTKLFEFMVEENHLTNHEPTNFQWSADGQTIFYQTYNRPSLIKFSVVSGEQTAYPFAYDDYRLNPATGVIVAWKKTSNVLAFFEAESMALQQIINLPSLPAVSQVSWGLKEDILQIRLGIYTYDYDPETDILQEIEGPLLDLDAFNPTHNLLISWRSFQLTLFDFSQQCNILVTKLPALSEKPRWYDETHLVTTVVTGRDKPVQVQLLEVELLTQQNSSWPCLR